MKDMIDNEYLPELMRSQFNVLSNVALHYSGAFPIPKPTDLMIIEAEDDKLLLLARRKNLKNLSPGVRVRTF